jgi:hypothetical protein
MKLVTSLPMSILQWIRVMGPYYIYAFYFMCKDRVLETVLAQP